MIEEAERRSVRTLEDRPARDHRRPQAAEREQGVKIGASSPRNIQPEKHAVAPSAAAAPTPATRSRRGRRAILAGARPAAPARPPATCAASTVGIPAIRVAARSSGEEVRVALDALAGMKTRRARPPVLRVAERDERVVHHDLARPDEGDEHARRDDVAIAQVCAAEAPSAVEGIRADPALAPRASGNGDKKERRSMDIVGLAAYAHDSAACLVRDGLPLAPRRGGALPAGRSTPTSSRWKRLAYCLAEGVKLSDVGGRALVGSSSTAERRIWACALHLRDSRGIIARSGAT
ncbi:MAG: hypothetical protein U0166_18620 [Acidobacteriota bacterium]